MIQAYVCPASEVVQLFPEAYRQQAEELIADLECDAINALLSDLGEDRNLDGIEYFFILGEDDTSPTLKHETLYAKFNWDSLMQYTPYFEKLIHKGCTLFNQFWTLGESKQEVNLRRLASTLDNDDQDDELMRLAHQNPWRYIHLGEDYLRVPADQSLDANVQLFTSDNDFSGHWRVTPPLRFAD